MAPDGNAVPPRRVTMVDVARRAGVSQSTVSFVLNNRVDKFVAEATRERVLVAAHEMGFRPNRNAQALRLDTAIAIGVITAGVATSPYAGRTLLGIQQAAHEAGYVSMVIDTTTDSNPSDIDEAAESLIDRGVAGLIYASPALLPIRASSHSETMRTVFVNCWPVASSRLNSLELPSPAEAELILGDEYGGGAAAAAAVFAAGHRHVAMLAGTSSERATVERTRGFHDAASSAGIDPATLTVLNGDYSIGSGHQLALDLLRRERPTAIVAGNDRMALGAILALHELQLRVPDDVSIVGYDDQAEFASELSPPLTTVELPFHAMGYAAGAALCAPKTARDDHLWIPCTLVKRESLSPPQGGRGVDRPSFERPGSLPT